MIYLDPMEEAEEIRHQREMRRFRAKWDAWDRAYKITPEKIMHSIWIGAFFALAAWFLV